MTDPRFTDPRLNDPMIRRDEWTSGRDENVGGMWSWVAGVSLLLLIGFLIFAGWNSNSNTANSGSPPTTTASRTGHRRAPRAPARHRRSRSPRRHRRAARSNKPIISRNAGPGAAGRRDNR